MRDKLQHKIGLAVIVTGLAVLLAGCLGTTPPTKLESSLFDVVTNYHPVVVVQTNVVPIYQTNTVVKVVQETNALNEVHQVWLTNVMVQTQYQTNVVAATNEVASYKYTEKEATKAGAQTAGGVLNMVAPGYGTLGALGLSLVLGAWAQLRSYKRGTAVDGIAQEVETMREFVKALPNGSTYDAALTDFLAKHQMETGIASTVLAALENKVSNPDAKVAAQGVIDVINSLRTTATPVAGVVVKV